MFEGEVHGRLQAEWEYPDNEPTVVYKLCGGPIVYVPEHPGGRAANTDNFQNVKRAFTVGGFRFYPLGYDFARNAVIAAVVDGPFWWLAVVRYWMQSIGKRILATLYIWGLADHPLGEEQTWRSVYVLRWAEKTIRKVRGG